MAWVDRELVSEYGDTNLVVVQGYGGAGHGKFFLGWWVIDRREGNTPGSYARSFHMSREDAKKAAEELVETVDAVSEMHA